ncbi:MAG: M20 family metallopeptidase [Trueperaceae bacterium]
MLGSLTERFEELFAEMVEFRRDLHMHPELSFEEDRTPRKIADYLTSLGLEVRTGVGGRGVVGVLEGARPGKTVALRADFDALPIQEENDLPYASKVPGVMHACGHDIHTATLLGVAKTLSKSREELSGRVVFIHQFAEEVAPGGAKPMIEDGCLDGMDVVYGAHVWSSLPLGKVGVRAGDAMAAADTFEVKVKGRGGHGAMPHLTVDPLVVASQLVLNLQQIVSRRVDPLKPAVVTVGSLHAGSAFNVIPDSAFLKGTVRTFDEEVRKEIETAIDQITQGTCAAAGATAEVAYRRGYPAVRNHVAETETIERLAREMLGDEQVTEVEPVMGGEDFAYYLEKVPGTFFFVGGSNEEQGMNFPHHHPRFNVDERSMLVGGKIFIAAVLEFLGSGETGTGETGFVAYPGEVTADA